MSLRITCGKLLTRAVIRWEVVWIPCTPASWAPVTSPAASCPGAFPRGFGRLARPWSSNSLEEEQAELPAHTCDQGWKLRPKGLLKGSASILPHSSPPPRPPEARLESQVLLISLVPAGQRAQLLQPWRARLGVRPAATALPVA